MEANGCVARGHDVNVMPGAGGVYRHSSRGVRRPALRPNGSERRPPVAQGSDSKASVLPKRHSVEVHSHSWLAEKSESRNVGTQRTLRRVSFCTLPRASITLRCMSPMRDTRCGFPSTPAMTSSELRVLTRSQARGWMCQVHPLSTTNVTPLCPLPRAWRLALQRSRPARSARAETVGPCATAATRLRVAATDDASALGGDARV
eukprot:5640949-Pleurochrysis_carterae.AAC.4